LKRLEEMSDPVAEFLAREDGALDNDIIDAPEQREQGSFNRSIHTFILAENGLPPVQNGIHRNGGDSGVDLAAQDVIDNTRHTPVSNGTISVFWKLSSPTFRTFKPDQFRFIEYNARRARDH
jgi:hypothetical protein